MTSTDGVDVGLSGEAARDAALVREYVRGRDAGCPGCGYNVRDLAAAVCPECGGRLELVLRVANGAGPILPRVPMSAEEAARSAGLAMRAAAGVFALFAAMSYVRPLAVVMMGLIALGFGWVSLRVGRARYWERIPEWDRRSRVEGR